MSLKSRFFTTLLAALFLALGGTSASAQTSKEELVFAGTVEISSTQIAFIISGQTGSGTLEFEGKEYEFSIGGLGVGGIGIQTLNAVGAVYNMDDVSKFAGTYAQARIGATVGKGSSVLNLKNGNGVHMDLRASNTGVALSLGADGLVVRMK